MSTDVMLREAPPMFDYAMDGEIVTLERYFEIAEENECIVEYIDGRIKLMPSVSNAHSEIQINAIVTLRTRLPLTEYKVHSPNKGVYLSPIDYYFPDLSVVRLPQRTSESRNFLLNPVLVVEILSPSTRDKDLYDKLPRYLDMPSMEHILIIEQDFVSVEHHRRVGNIWTQTTYTDLDDIVPLDSLGASLPLAQVYNLIEFSQA